jgi:hypothetical protein
MDSKTSPADFCTLCVLCGKRDAAGSHLTIQQFKNLFHSSFLRAVLFQAPFVSFGIRRHHSVISQLDRLGQFRQFHPAQPPPQIQRQVPSRVAIFVPKFSPLPPFDLINRGYDCPKRRSLRPQSPGPALLLVIPTDMLPLLLRRAESFAFVRG